MQARPGDRWAEDSSEETSSRLHDPESLRKNHRNPAHPERQSRPQGPCRTEKGIGMKTQNLSAIAAVGTLVFATVIPAVADVPYALLHSFFDPETNSWCGSSWCGTENGYR